MTASAVWTTLIKVVHTALAVISVGLGVLTWRRATTEPLEPAVDAAAVSPAANAGRSTSLPASDVRGCGRRETSSAGSALGAAVVSPAARRRR